MNNYTQDSFFSEEEPLDGSELDAMEAEPDAADGEIDDPEAADDTESSHEELDSDSQEEESDAIADIGEPETAIAAPPEDAGEPDDTALDASDEAPSEPAAPTSVLVDPGQEAIDTFFGPVRLDRPRPERPQLIPRWIWIALASVAAVALVAAGIWVWSTSLANIPVPPLTGVDVGVARTRLAIDGLKLTVAEQRFSAKPSQEVLSQDPPSGTRLKRGATVAVVISAGTEQFSMPDVVGNGVLLARGRLETKGLDVRVEAQPSQMPSDTVLASNPAAGQIVHTGDIVRLTVAAPGPKTELLLPFDLSGVTIVLDPAPVNDALGDVPLDVARRVRSLIEASHGVVRTTRALADTSTLEGAPVRAQRAAVGTATAAVGLSADTVGSGGLIVFAPSPILPLASASARLASQLTSDLASEAGPVASATSSTDTVLAAAQAPWSRVQLGSYSSREDVAKFADPNWEDSIARGIYRALGALYGKKPAGG